MRGVHHNSSDFSDTVRRFLRHHYVERQIYLRSRGQVQFISLSPFTQAVFLAIGLVFFGWIAFSSVNVVFKQQIIASKDQRYVKMQGAYEERLAHLQSSYDELNGQLVISQERFLASTREIEEKHRQLTALMGQRRSAGNVLDHMRQRYAATMRDANTDTHGNTILMSVDQDSEGVNIAQTTTRPQRSTDSGTYVIDGQESGGIDIAGLAGDTGQIGTASLIDTKLTNLDRAQQSLINTIDETTDRRIRELTSIIDMTKVADVRTLVRGSKDGARGSKAGNKKSSGDENAEGGPFLGLADSEALAGAANESAFAKQISRVSQNINTMGELETTIAKMPLAEPLISYHQTSGFGPRRDPFNGRMAFHAGEDMATAYGTKVYATTPGTVVFADWRGAYGRMIEVDIGNGFRTRYGHLSAINVKVGQKVAFRDVIGRVGSSGRSSGPHLHYEVWFDGIVRDPTKFIEAGHYVFSKR
ncbi:MAG: peptidoglycan DD-metalloendopeptidase family protein [Parvibaculum sp.]|nr:peptidoglycan DD-metalloendopeptidase family protein [Parvibaculum sp.]|tara:strand:+ start:4546 stop:5964 length:1419 start_codon:yes stop_codon:yes gene_type:complete